jgi:hypothetical protein
MNNALLAAIGSDPDIKLFDVFGLVSNVIADPGAFGLSNVTDACAIDSENCEPLVWHIDRPSIRIRPSSDGLRQSTSLSPNSQLQLFLYLRQLKK